MRGQHEQANREWLYAMTIRLLRHEDSRLLQKPVMMVKGKRILVGTGRYLARIKEVLIYHITKRDQNVN